MASHPLVSIIIPVFNSEKFIEETVNSILNQTFNNFELILVNDGSVDKSAQICEEFLKKDKRVRVYHIENSGPGNARNNGLSLAKGEFIQFVDSDDQIDMNMVEQLIEYILIEKTDVVVCGIKKINFANRHETIYSSPTKLSMNIDIKLEFIQLLKKGLAYSPTNKLYKKSIIDKYNIKFNSEILIGEDALFNIEYFSYCSKIFICEKPLYFYIQRMGSLTNKFYKEKDKAQILLFRKLNEFLGALEPNILKEVNAYYLMEFSYIIYQNSIGIRNIREFVSRVKSTKKFINSPEFKTVSKNSYSYSLIQSVVLLLSRFKCESFLLIILYCHNRFYNKPLL